MQKAVSALASVLLREPLVYFLLAGAAIFLAWGWLEERQGRFRIEVKPQERTRIAAQWEAQMGRAPSADEMTGLVERFVREEIYYREALRMGLDQDDTIIRRRLAQKLGFLTEDIATAQDPTQDELRAFYAEHAERYRTPERVSFRHRYFSAERRADAAAAAARAAAALQRGDAADPGDAFILQSTFADRSLREIGDLFGNAFAESIAGLSAGRWHAPVESAYGWHAVFVEGRLAERQPAFSEVAARVANDHAQAQRAAANARYYEALKARYEVVYR